MRIVTSSNLRWLVQPQCHLIQGIILKCSMIISSSEKEKIVLEFLINLYMIVCDIHDGMSSSPCDSESKQRNVLLPAWQICPMTRLFLCMNVTKFNT